MTGFLHAAWVIGRRDFVASVWSRSFLFFLIGPLLIITMSAGFGSITQNVAQENARTTVAVIVPDDARASIDRAARRLGDGLQDRAFPAFRFFPPEPDVDAQAQRLLGSRTEKVSAALTGDLEHPRLHGPVTPGNVLHRQIDLVVDQARRAEAAARGGVDYEPVRIPVSKSTGAAGPVAAARAITATIGQFLVFFLTVLLSGMLLSNLLEEKSNKIIEVLAAAVPVDAIFLGKVFSMLAISLTGIAVWCTAALLTGFAFAGGVIPPQPAVGWAFFIFLVVAYFSINYLLLGALFLGIGSQANSVREVQTLSMPITVGQMLIFGLAVAGGTAYAGPLGLTAAIFPFSSPLMMVSWAAQDPGIWPHLLALLWQGLWVWLVVRFGASLFRRNVLKSGPSLRQRLFGRKRSGA